MRRVPLISSVCLVLAASIAAQGLDEEREEGALEPGPRGSQILAAVGLASTVGAVVSDALVEWNYDKYNKAEESEECVKYRERTILTEHIRDGFLYSALASFATAVVLSRFEQGSFSANVHIRPDSLCQGQRFEVSLVKSF